MEPKSREPQAPAQDQEEPCLPDLGERVNAIRSRLGAGDADLIVNAPADLAYLLDKLGGCGPSPPNRSGWRSGDGSSATTRAPRWRG